MKERLRFSLFFLSLLSTLLSFPSRATGAANVSRSPNWESTSPRIAVDSAGNIHVVYAEYYGGTSGDAYYCKYSVATQAWSTPLNLSNSSLVYSDEYRCVGIDIDGAGNIYVVYLEGEKIAVRICSGGSWGAAMEVATSPADIDSPRVAVDASGNIFITWWSKNYVVYSRARIGGTWEGVRSLSTSPSKFPDIAVGNKTAFCAWTGKNSSNVYQIYYVKRNKSFDASWTSPQLVAASGDKQQVPAVEMDANDLAHVVFTPNFADGSRRVDYSYWTGSGFSSPQAISEQTLLHYPALYERGNNLYACWQVGAFQNGQSVNFNTRINGSWEGEARVSDSEGCTFADIATSPSQDRIYVVWDGSQEIWCNMGASGPPQPSSANPVASFVFSPQSGAAPLVVTFDGSSSYDPDGNIISYDWNFGDGEAGTGAIVAHTYTTAGTFTARLTVTDNDGKTGGTSKRVEVIKPNEPPVAEFGYTPSTGIFPVEITFDASASRDPDGNIVQYGWDFGDGGGASGRMVKHTYNRWGIFYVRLTVQDDLGSTSTSVRNITILRLFQPLDIRWQTYADESLFRTRYVTQVTWSKNPANDSLGAQIVLYRVFRKKTGESDAFYRAIGEVTADVSSYLDKDTDKSDTYVYTVTCRDSQGHESPIVGGQGNSSVLEGFRGPQGVQKRGKLTGG